MHVERKLAPKGEYSSKYFERKLARDRFFEDLCALEESKKMKAAPIADLRRSVYPLFVAAQCESDLSVTSESCGLVLDALFAWANRFNLTVRNDGRRIPASWVRKAAGLTLYLWNRWESFNAQVPPPVWAGGAIYTEFDFLKWRAEHPSGDFSFSLSGPKPDPLKEKFADFRARVMRGFEPLLKSEWDSVVEKVDSSDLVKWKLKRQTEHFRWLCLYQIDQWSCKRIADECQGPDGLDSDTVRRGIETAASMIGLDLRSGRRGLTRKSGVSS
jgi:hypothetical protein